jgi:broad specificity phosphatase PhoE
LSYLYLIRHGQAGTREHYDTLSPAGHEQARSLGDYLVSQGLKFSAAFAGTLCRQIETAHEVMGAYQRSGVDFPELQIEPGWREFDLDHVYRGIAPQMCGIDPEFRRDYEAMVEQVRASCGDAQAAVHRRWSPCDIKVVDAWIQGRYDYDGESWNSFRERVCDVVSGHSGRGNTIVFTSATPIAICAALGLDIFDDRILRIAGVLYNASITTLRVRPEQIRLFSLNGVPHLPSAELRTHR